MNLSDVGKLIYCRGFFESSTWIIRADRKVLIKGDFFRRVLWAPEDEWSVISGPLRLVLDGKNARVEYRILCYIREYDCQVAELTSYIAKEQVRP